MVHAVENNAHSFPSSDQGRDTDHETDERQNTPGTASTTEGYEQGSGETTDDTGDAETTREDNTRAVAVADRPPDEVGMGLAPKRPLNCGNDVVERRRVGGILKSVKQGVALFGGKIELTAASIGDVNGNDTANLLAVGLDGH